MDRCGGDLSCRGDVIPRQSHHTIRLGNDVLRHTVVASKAVPTWDFRVESAQSHEKTTQTCLCCSVVRKSSTSANSVCHQKMRQYDDSMHRHLTPSIGAFGLRNPVCQTVSTSGSASVNFSLYFSKFVAACRIPVDISHPYLTWLSLPVVICLSVLCTSLITHLPTHSRWLKSC